MRYLTRLGPVISRSAQTGLINEIKNKKIPPPRARRPVWGWRRIMFFLASRERERERMMILRGGKKKMQNQRGKTRKIIYSIIKVIDWIFARLFIFIIPILILCIGIIFIDSIYTWITSIYGRGYGNLTIGKTAMKIASLCMFYPLIYLWRFLIKKVLRL